MRAVDNFVDNAQSSVRSAFETLTLTPNIKVSYIALGASILGPLATIPYSPLEWVQLITAREYK